MKELHATQLLQLFLYTTAYLQCKNQALFIFIM